MGAVLTQGWGKPGLQDGIPLGLNPYRIPVFEETAVAPHRGLAWDPLGRFERSVASPDNSGVFEAKGRKRRADKVSFTPAVIVVHSVEEPERGKRSQCG